MRVPLAALIAGLIFGAGLAMSDMINPARVLAFLDPFGSWDPTLAFVIAGALIPAATGFVWTRRLATPLFEKSFFIPENRTLDRQLLVGAALFGAGWGLVGYCPGPALAALALGFWQAWIFAVAMVAGMALHRTSVDALRLRAARRFRLET